MLAPVDVIHIIYEYINLFSFNILWYLIPTGNGSTNNVDNIYMGAMRIFEKMGSNTMILALCVLVILYVAYSFITSTTEVYYYPMEELTKNSKSITVERDVTYTHYTHAYLYDSQKNRIGTVSSVNFHKVMDGVNRVTTVTTFSTKKGTIVCNLYYETDSENQPYLQGAADITPEHKTGAYANKKVIMNIIGNPKGDRELTIHTSNKLF